MKLTYIKPTLEVYRYQPECGYQQSLYVGLSKKDYILLEGTDGTKPRTGEEITEITDASDEYESGLWSF